MFGFFLRVEPKSQNFEFQLMGYLFLASFLYASKFTCAIYSSYKIVIFSLFVLLLLYISRKENVSKQDIFHKKNAPKHSVHFGWKYILFELLGRVFKRALSGIIFETEGSVQKIQKGHFLTSEKLKKAPLCPPPMFIASLKLFWQNKFLKKVSHQGQRPEVRLSFSLK